MLQHAIQFNIHRYKTPYTYVCMNITVHVARLFDSNSRFFFLWLFEKKKKKKQDILIFFKYRKRRKKKRIREN